MDEGAYSLQLGFRSFNFCMGRALGLCHSAKALPIRFAAQRLTRTRGTRRCLLFFAQCLRNPVPHEFAVVHAVSPPCHGPISLPASRTHRSTSLRTANSRDSSTLAHILVRILRPWHIWRPTSAHCFLLFLSNLFQFVAEIQVHTLSSRDVVQPVQHLSGFPLGSSHWTIADVGRVDVSSTFPLVGQSCS